MKRCLKPVVIGLSMLGMISLPAFGASNSAQIKALKKEVASLEKQVNALAHNDNTAHHKISVQKSHKRAKNGLVQRGTTTVQGTQTQNTTTQTMSNEEIQAVKISGSNYVPYDFDVPGKALVSSGPYLGVPYTYSGSNLIINTPSINEDVSLLKMRQSINKRLAEEGITSHEDHSHVLLSGIIEGQASYNWRGGQPNTSDIDVTSAELDSYILGPSSWTSGLLALAYDNDIGAVAGVNNSNNRISNSRVIINKAFITLGDFSKTPFYGSIGQMYVPFGTYSSSMITSPLTKTVARTKDRAVLLGFQQQAPDAFYASTYIFRGDSYVGSTNRINNGGVNVGYKFVAGRLSGDVGAGWIRNIADATGMQFTESRPLFDGFGSASRTCGPAGTSACGNEVLVHRAPAYDAHVSFSLGERWDFLAEYIQASSAFSAADMTFNSHGAQPSALNSELAYSFTTFGNKPTSVAVGYGMTKQALAIGLPQNRYSAVINTSWWKNTLQSLEFRHDKNYAASAYASGSGVSAGTGTGKSNNVLTAQMDMYF